jgi:hypothetical protein
MIFSERGSSLSSREKSSRKKSLTMNWRIMFPGKPDERFVLDRAIAETSIFSDEFCSEYGDKLREMLTDHIDSQVPFSLTVRFENEKIPSELYSGGKFPGADGRLAVFSELS